MCTTAADRSPCKRNASRAIGSETSSIRVNDADLAPVRVGSDEGKRGQLQRLGTRRLRMLDPVMGSDDACGVRRLPPQHDPIEREGLSDLAKAVDDGVIDRAGLDRRKSPGEVGDQSLEAKPASRGGDQTMPRGLEGIGEHRVHVITRPFRWIGRPRRSPARVIVAMVGPMSRTRTSISVPSRVQRVSETDSNSSPQCF